VLVAGLGLATGLLILATVLDMPALRFAALASLLGILIARELWMWQGWRWELGAAFAVVVVAALAFAVQRLAG
jgi:hypothetical protein